MDLFTAKASLALLVFSAKAALILLASLVMARLLRRTDADLRHRVLSAGIVGVMGVAVFAPVLPDIPVPLFAADSVGHFLEGPIEYEFLGAGVEVIGEPRRGVLPLVPAAVFENGSAEGVKIAPGMILWMVWLIGSAAVFARMALRRFALGRMLRVARPAVESSRRRLVDLSRRIGLRRPVRLVSHPAIHTPFATGIWRSTIVMPADGPDGEVRDAILLHELNHILRADLVSQTCAAIVCALQWWNPLAWLAARQLARERERACDAAVLAQGVRPSFYAGILLHLSRGDDSPLATPVAPLSPSLFFKERIMDILHNELRGRRIRPAVNRLALALVVALVTAVGLVQPGGTAARPATIAVHVNDAGLNLSRAELRQGEATVVEVRGSQTPTFARGRFLERAVRFGVVDGAMHGFLAVPADTPPGAYEVQVACTFADGSSRTLKTEVRVVLRDYQAVKWPFNDKVRMPTEIAHALSKSNERPLWSGPFKAPLSGRRTAEFGLIKLVGESRLMHDGVDLAAPLGTPVSSANGGQVVLVRELPVSGKTVVVDHGLGLLSAYLHLDRVDVKEGQQVVSGAVLGACGSTGRSTAPHVHWMMVFDGVPCDPISFIEQF